MSVTSPLHLAVALEGTGWHPAAWREPGARPGDLLTAGYWADLAREAERGLLDFVTIEDSLGLQSSRPLEPDQRTDQVRGRLDAVLIAARVAPLTSGIGLVPTVVTTHTEPFHASKAIATLDYVATGRAGVRVQVTARPYEAALFGRRAVPPAAVLADRSAPAARAFLDGLLAEAADYVEVLRRLWDSWEDGAEIRDAATGRFIDRDKLHYIDFAGDYFAVRGPSITPRPPQGQPVVAALAHGPAAYRLAAGSADVAFVTPRDAADARAITAQLSREQEAAGRAGPLHVLADLVVFLDRTAAAAAARQARLDEQAGAAYRSDAAVFAGTPGDLADLLLDWQASGLSGFRLRPGTIPGDLRQVTGSLVPELQRRGAFRRGYEAATLRGLLGLPRPASRYAGAAASTREVPS